MLIKQVSDHNVIQSATCGTVREILTGDEYKPFGLAVCYDIKPTTAHYHKTFDETYFVLDGEIELELYDPVHKNRSRQLLKANEAAVISKGIHHKISKSTPSNRLAVISAPPFHADDETPSDIL